MNSDSESGFTLIEMLIGLLVLSFSALALSTTLTSAFQSHQKIEAYAKKVSSYDRLSSVLREIGRSQFVKHDANTAMIETRIPLANAQSLSISNDNDSYTLSIEDNAQNITAITLLESQNPLRFQFETAVPDSNQRLSSQARQDKFLAVESKVDNNWAPIISVPLLVAVQPDCRYDIVGRRCR